MREKVISFDLNLCLWRILLFIWVFLHLAFSHYYATQSDKKPNCYFCFYLCLMLTISTIIYEHRSSLLRDQIMLSDKRSIFKSSRFFVYFITRSTNRRWENIQATLMFSKQNIGESLKQIQNSFLIVLANKVICLLIFLHWRFLGGIGIGSTWLQREMYISCYTVTQCYRKITAIFP